MNQSWTHCICPPCFGEKFPGREPVRVKDAPVQPCCFCKTPTNAGIFVRFPPQQTPCEGNHATAE